MRWGLCVFLVAGMALSFASGVQSEPAPGSISGTVTGPDGARLPGAVVTIEGTDRAGLRVVSGDLGAYRATGLASGRHQVSAELSGFRPLRVADVLLAAGEARALDLRLEVAGVSETVTVLGAAPGESLEASEIRESGARDVGEALSATPGLWKLRKGGIANEIVLRGFQSRDLTVLIDGERVLGACPNHMDPPAFHVDFAEVDRIEVGKGPFEIRNQGSLGGAVNVVTRKPEAGWHGRLNLAGGSFGFLNPSANASYGGRELSALVGYSYRVSDPYRDGAGARVTEVAAYRGDEGESHAFEVGTAWGRLAWAPVAGHRLSLSYTRQQADHVLYPYLLMDAVYDDTDRAQLAYEADRLGGLRAFKLRAYGTRVDHWMTDARRTSAAGTPRGYSMGTRAKTESLGAKAEGSLGRLAVGVEWTRQGWDGSTEMAGMQYRPQASIPDVVTTTVGAYAEHTRSVGQRSSLSLGARLDRASSEADAAKANLRLFQAYHGSSAGSATNWLPSGKLRLTVRPTAGLEVALGVGHTERVPEASERYFGLQRMGSDWVGNPQLAPSRNTGAEGSLGYTRRSLSFSSSLFWNRIEDFIVIRDLARVQMVPGVMNGRARSYANVDATLRGGEATAVLALVNRLFVSGSASYVRGSTKSGELAEMPPLGGRIGLRFDDGRFFALAEGLFARRQERVDSALRETPTPGHGTGNLSLGLRRGRWSVSAGIANLFDREYVEHLSYQRDPFRSGVRVPEPGRNLFVNATAGW